MLNTEWLTRGRATVALVVDNLERHERAYVNELEAFAEAIRSGREQAPTGEDGLAAIRLAEACRKALDSRQAVLVGHKITSSQDDSTTGEGERDASIAKR